ncbi:MAG: trypsin-like peptidase domain-containing protein [Candidatus Omnitrophica bacterium]|nr:trypsin-like peptidase domain-containing protein [Candidatus Omnitrophota bacterium]
MFIFRPSRTITVPLQALPIKLWPRLLSRSASSFVMAQCLFFLFSSFGWADSNRIDRIQKTKESMVTIRTELTRTMPKPHPRTVTYERTAAGLVIDPYGIIVTNTHTIIHAPFIFVLLRDGTKLPAKILFSSKNYDFSFLKIRPPYPLQSVQWADSSLVKIGDHIIAVRNSDYNGQSIMSAHIKRILKRRRFTNHDFLELDIDLTHGDSGGPILDDQGRLLGMIMAKRQSMPNSSIAIASNKIRQQYLQYKKNMP